MVKQNTAPTMKDVAKEAGVSLGTVSKVINGIPVGEEYRKKVEQAIKELDYHLNAYARGLKSNRTNTIAVILPTIAPQAGTREALRRCPLSLPRLPAGGWKVLMSAAPLSLFFIIRDKTSPCQGSRRNKIRPGFSPIFGQFRTVSRLCPGKGLPPPGKAPVHSIFFLPSW